MAENKKSIVLYVDLIHTFEELTDAQAGRLIKHLLRYVNDQNPEPPDKLTRIAFEPIKQQLKRDLKKYEAKKNQWSEAGKASAEKRKALKISETSTLSTDVANRSTVSTVSVNDSVTVNDNVSVSVEEEKGKSAAPSYSKSSTKPFVQKTLLPLDTLKEKYFADVAWIQLAGKTISKTEAEVKKLVEEFVLFLKSTGCVSKEETDFLKHFFNWINKKGFNNINNNQNGRPSTHRGSDTVITEKQGGYGKL